MYLFTEKVWDCWILLVYLEFLKLAEKRHAENSETKPKESLTREKTP